MNFTKTRSKVCKKCNIRKPISSFSRQKVKNKKNKYYYKSSCSGCYSAIYRERHPETISKISKNYKQNYRKKRLKMKQELLLHINQTICKNCGYSDIRALSFHHRNEKEKEFEISYGFTHSYGLDLLKKEAEKCDILCLNCHCIEHMKPIDE